MMGLDQEVRHQQAVLKKLFETLDLSLGRGRAEFSDHEWIVKKLKILKGQVELFVDSVDRMSVQLKNRDVLCQAPDCPRFARAKGYCSKHYQQIYHHGPA